MATLSVTKEGSGLKGKFVEEPDRKFDVTKIEFAKMTRITQFIYETGTRLADLDHAPVRDHLGPRAGKGSR